MTRLFNDAGATEAAMDPTEGTGCQCRVRVLQSAIRVAMDVLSLPSPNFNELGCRLSRNTSAFCALKRYVHTMPHDTQRQSVARPHGKSCTMPQVYVDVASANLRHAVRCCAA